MHLWDDDLWLLLLHPLILVSSMCFILAYLVGFTAFVETTAYSIDELKTADFLTLTEYLSLKLSIKPIEETQVSVIILRVALTKIYALTTINVKLKMCLSKLKHNE